MRYATGPEVRPTVDHGALPEWLLEKLAHPPRAGEGVNRWLFKMARLMRGWQDEQVIVARLIAAVANCGRQINQNEILRAVRRAPTTRRSSTSLPSAATPLATAGTYRTLTRWPAPDWSRIAEHADRGTVETLRAGSPMPSDCLTAADVRASLWSPDEFVCIARSHPRDAVTMPLREWLTLDVATHSLIVPNAMSSSLGRTQDGKPSPRCLDNTGPRQWIVVEFDFCPEGPAGNLLRGRSSQDLCAAMLLHLQDRGAPLALAVSSGGKSIHGWFPALGLTDDKLKAFFNAACRLGADPVTWSRCQLVRLPGGMREDGRRQPVLFCDPCRLPHPEAMVHHIIHHHRLVEARELLPDLIPF